MHRTVHAGPDLLPRSPVPLNKSQLHLLDGIVDPASGVEPVPHLGEAFDVTPARRSYGVPGRTVPRSHLIIELTRGNQTPQVVAEGGDTHARAGPIGR